MAERLREEPGAAANVFIHDGATMTQIFAVPRGPEGLRDEPYGVVASRAGNTMITSDGGQIVVFDGVGQRRVAISGNEGDGIYAYVRDDTAFAYRDSTGTLEASLKVLSLVTGDQEPAELRDYPVFDQGIFDLEGTEGGWGNEFYAAPRYRGDDVPTGIALVEAAMAEISDDQRAEIARDRIVTE